jgi:F-type H+-transporting ATPase subunit delta
MATTTDTRAIAAALFEALVGSAANDLRIAAPKLAQLSGDSEQLQDKVLAALPSSTLPQVRNFVLGLAKEGLLDRIGEVVESFESFVKGAPTRPLEAFVTSAVALSTAQQGRVEADLRQRYGADIAVTFDIDESLIGGLVIRVGDQVLDNSLRTRLGSIQRSMLTS